MELAPEMIEPPFPLLKRKYAPIPTAIKIRIIKIQIQAEPLLFFIIFNLVLMEDLFRHYLIFLSYNHLLLLPIFLNLQYLN